MNDLRKAAQQTLEILDWMEAISPNKPAHDALIVLRAALAQPEQEPVDWEMNESGRTIQDSDWSHDFVLRVDGDFESDAQRIEYVRGIVSKLNAAPPQRKPLTVDQISEIDCYDHLKFARRIERAHGIGDEV